MSNGLMLPSELSGLLNTLGFNWPLSNEGKMFDLGGQWSGFAGKLEHTASETDGHTQQMLSSNSGEAMEKLKAFWSHGEAPKQNLEDGSIASTLVGTGLYVCAGVVIALKTAVIVQLAMLAVEIAQAIATAFVTFGASLLEIPAFRALTKLLIDQALNLAMNSVLNG
ncbi:hypothetical protein D5S17_15215 [Pseudonocardiaceae bacterium YIM PH 21723]|nr:hypothetical protein D5S17_15215 [Pseudonocardiaceae bacterium YIM PH 21723]